ncbi:MAG: hypothetical protein A2176_10015 [Spirochaetes bacterium RBG_13_51_14]|nr:MAG: hypothetical protein A2176_10015 [Spirochaetes bacterium RBG_13_51_14]
MHPAAPPLTALKQVDTRLVEDIRRKEEAGDETGEERMYLLCKTCGNAITSESYCMEVNGSHRHTFMNPRGIVFNIGCFSSAGGCLIIGVPTTEYTWFPGFTWCCVICSQCLSHLGWRYQSGSGGFFGLILDQLSRQ